MGMLDSFKRDAEKTDVEKMTARRDVKGLMKALRHEDSTVRTRAAQALGEMGDAKAVGPLVQALRDDYYDVRARAAYALGKMGDAGAVGLVIQALKHEDAVVRARAAEALGKIRDAKAVGPLIQALRDKDEKVRASAAYALGDIGGAGAVAPLVQALNDEGVFREGHGIPIGVRGAVAPALARIGEPAIEPLIGVILEKSGDTQDKSIMTLYNVMDAIPADDVQGVVERLKVERAIEPLIEALRRQDIQQDADIPGGPSGSLGLPACIMRLFDMTRDERAVEPLIQILETREAASGSTMEAGRALANIVPHLCRLGKLDPGTVSRAVAALEETPLKWAVGEIGMATGNAELLLAGLKDASYSKEETRRYARALEETGDKRAVRPLLEVAVKYLKEAEPSPQATEARSEELEEMILRGETALAGAAVELVNTAIRIAPEEAYRQALEYGNAYILKLAGEALGKTKDGKE